MRINASITHQATQERARNEVFKTYCPFCKNEPNNIKLIDHVNDRVYFIGYKCAQEFIKEFGPGCAQKVVNALLALPDYPTTRPTRWPCNG